MENKEGVLTLIPTPIDEQSPLEQTAHNLLLNAAEKGNSLFVIEDLKPGRRRWLKWKLPRKCVDDFILYNEHSAREISSKLLTELKKGRNVYLMSDGGLPAFCDPGIELVDLCHKNGIKVTSTPFANSISLALALSGFSHNKFVFEGFLPRDTGSRKGAITAILKEPRTTILMDTPYRLKKTLEELKTMMNKLHSRREVFLAMNLNEPDSELLLRGTPSDILNKLETFKHEFILIIAPGKKAR